MHMEGVRLLVPKLRISSWHQQSVQSGVGSCVTDARVTRREATLAVLPTGQHLGIVTSRWPKVEGTRTQQAWHQAHSAWLPTSWVTKGGCLSPVIPGSLVCHTKKQAYGVPWLLLQFCILF